MLDKLHNLDSNIKNEIAKNIAKDCSFKTIITIGKYISAMQSSEKYDLNMVDKFKEDINMNNECYMVRKALQKIHPHGINVDDNIVISRTSVAGSAIVNNLDGEALFAISKTNKSSSSPGTASTAATSALGTTIATTTTRTAFRMGATSAMDTTTGRTKTG